MIVKKICSKCGVEKSLDEFNKNSSKRDGVQVYCKICNRKDMSERLKKGDERSIHMKNRLVLVKQ